MNEQKDLVRQHIRGSSLLLLGRLFALLMNFGVQVLVVRYLVKAEFGAFAYAIAAVSLCSSCVLLGLNRAVNRFVPIYLEKGDHARAVGTILLAVANCLGLGLALVVLVFGLQDFLGSHVIQSDGASDGTPLPLSLLLILIALSPLEALDNVFQGLLAVFASPRAIFFRRHILTPCLRLGSVLTVMAMSGSVHLLATLYLIAGLIGTTAYVLVLFRILRNRGLFSDFKKEPPRVSPREIYAFSLPMLTTEAFLVLKTSLAVLLLEFYKDSAAVAEFRAVVPVAGLTLVVLQSLKMLYTPTASRLYAREDVDGINALYWQSASWVALMSFPVFVVCVLFYEPITVLLFGEQYAGAGLVLAVLAVGNYINAALGMNTYTLQVYARVRTVATNSVIAALLGLGLNLWLIPTHGAIGAAWATSGAIVVHNLLNQAGLHFGTGVDVLRMQGLRVYGSILLVTLGLVVLHTSFELPLVALVILVVFAFLILLRINRKELNIANAFPEIAKVPGFRFLLAMERGR